MYVYFFLLLFFKLYFLKSKCLTFQNPIKNQWIEPSPHQLFAYENCLFMFYSIKQNLECFWAVKMPWGLSDCKQNILPSLNLRSQSHMFYWYIISENILNLCVWAGFNSAHLRWNYFSELWRSRRSHSMKIEASH